MCKSGNHNTFLLPGTTSFWLFPNGGLSHYNHVSPAVCSGHRFVKWNSAATFTYTGSWLYSSTIRLYMITARASKSLISNFFPVNLNHKDVVVTIMEITFLQKCQVFQTFPKQDNVMSLACISLSWTGAEHACTVFTLLPRFAEAKRKRSLLFLMVESTACKRNVMMTQRNLKGNVFFLTTFSIRFDIVNLTINNTVIWTVHSCVIFTSNAMPQCWIKIRQFPTAFCWCLQTNHGACTPSQ